MSGPSHLAKILPDLLALAEKDPLAAVELWLKAFNANVSRIMLDTYERAFVSLAEKARSAVNDTDASKLEHYLVQAESEIGDAMKRASAPYNLGFSLSDRGAVLGPSRLHKRQRPELAHLDQSAAPWGGEDWYEWLNRGFASIRQRSANAHLAFPPLRLYPVGRYIEQLSACLDETAEFGSPMRKRVLAAIQGYLKTGRPHESDNDTLFWHLFLKLGFQDPNFSVGRSYVARKAASAAQIPDETIAYICDAAWECSGSPSSRASFCEFLCVKTDSPVATATMIAAILEEAAFEESLTGDTVPYAASRVLLFLASDVASVSDHLDQLIAAGRLQLLSQKVSRDVIRNTTDLVRELRRLATQAMSAEVWLPPKPVSLVEARILELEGANGA